MSIVIIGSGFAGIGMAIQLKKAGIHDFVILERGNDLGGAWRDNTYPGCACDVQSHVYSFSFEPNPSWGRAFAPQPEILAYIRHCATKYGVLPHIRFGQNVKSARFDDAASEWTVETATETLRARVVISGAGALCNPATPALPGIERFRGAAFHSAEWDHSVDLDGKRVAVIGTGASAIQFVPQIAPRVRELHLYQRTPPWIMPKPDREIGGWEHELYRRVPLTQKLMRGAIYSRLEGRVLAFAVHPGLMKAAGRMAKAHIDAQIASPELRRKVTPDYTMGCKRVLLSNDYYPSLALPQVDVITNGIREVREGSIVADDGTERPVDVIVYGTGFKVQEVVARGMFFGRGGVDVVDTWTAGPEAYKGTAIAGFPNLFMILGPNTGLGHNSMVYMIESQVAYIVDALQKMRKEGWATVDVKPQAQTEYNRGIQAELGKAVWQTGCKSWYLDENGKNTALWPGFTFRFRKQTAEFDSVSYVIERTGKAKDASDTATNSSQRAEETIQEVA